MQISHIHRLFGIVFILSVTFLLIALIGGLYAQLLERIIVTRE